MAESQSPPLLPSVSVLPQHRTPESIRKWIQEVCEALSVSPTKLASMAEISHTTISRFQSGKSINKNISPSTIGAISAVIVDAIQRGQITHKEDKYAHVKLKSDLDLDKILSQNKSKLTFSGYVLQEVQVVGHVGYGIRQKGGPETMWKDVKLAALLPEELIGSPVFGLEMREEDNKLFRHGDILFCTDDIWAFSQLKPKACVVATCVVGDGLFENRLYISRSDPDGGTWLAPTWKHWDPSQQIYLGDDPRNSLFEQKGLVVVVASMSAHIPPGMLSTQSP